MFNSRGFPVAGLIVVFIQERTPRIHDIRVRTSWLPVEPLPGVPMPPFNRSLRWGMESRRTNSTVVSKSHGHAEVRRMNASQVHARWPGVSSPPLTIDGIIIHRACNTYISIILPYDVDIVANACSGSRSANADVFVQELGALVSRHASFSSFLD